MLSSSESSPLSRSEKSNSSSHAANLLHLLFYGGSHIDLLLPYMAQNETEILIKFIESCEEQNRRCTGLRKQ